MQNWRLRTFFRRTVLRKDIKQIPRFCDPVYQIGYPGKKDLRKKERRYGSTEPNLPVVVPGIEATADKQDHRQNHSQFGNEQNKAFCLSVLHTEPYRKEKNCEDQSPHRHGNKDVSEQPAPRDRFVL